MRSRGPVGTEASGLGQMHTQKGWTVSGVFIPFLVSVVGGDSYRCNSPVDVVVVVEGESVTVRRLTAVAKAVGRRTLVFPISVSVVPNFCERAEIPVKS